MQECTVLCISDFQFSNSIADIFSSFSFLNDKPIWPSHIHNSSISFEKFPQLKIRFFNLILILQFLLYNYFLNITYITEKKILEFDIIPPMRINLAQPTIFRGLQINIKRGCVFLMVIWSAFRMGQHIANDHLYHALQFIKVEQIAFELVNHS